MNLAKANGDEKLALGRGLSGARSLQASDRQSRGVEASRILHDIDPRLIRAKVVGKPDAR